MTQPLGSQGLTLVSQMPSAIRTIPAKKRIPCVSSNTTTPAEGMERGTSVDAGIHAITRKLEFILQNLDALMTGAEPRSSP